MDALEHLSTVLDSRARNCGCLDEFLNLTAKEALLKGDQQTINERINQGLHHMMIMGRSELCAQNRGRSLT
jgi:hypothetical protein